jgi:site-specific DNA-methyltransferase (adenine-specific)
MASVFIRWLTEPGDTVYDPFSGRGTVALEAVLQGRKGFGADANPLAHALTRAKVKIPAASAVDKRLNDLKAEFEGSASLSVDSVPEDIGMLYSPGTLRQINFLRERLSGRGYVDPFIIALVLGMLHANHSAGGATRGFSISMPNTFAMAPGYVRKYIRDHELIAPDLDVFEMLRARADQYGLPEKALVRGRSWLGDASMPAPADVKSAKPKLVFTSPPYLQVIKYGKYNWVRLWFLGQEAGEVDQRLMASSSLSRYLVFMKKVLEGIKSTLDTEGYVCLVIGDVRRGEEQLNLAEEVWERVARPAGWQHHGTIVDALPVGGKVSRIWKDNPGRATKTDRLLLLSPWPGVSLPPFPEIDWSHIPELQNSATARG